MGEFKRMGLKWGLRAVVAGGGLPCGVRAGEYVWTGAQDACWTNAANWTVDGAVAANPPGWVLATTSGGVLTTNGTPADVAVFGACASGRTTINLDGQWKIDSVVFTNGAPAYTLGTSVGDKAQFLMLGLKARIAVAEAVTADQTIQVLSSTYDRSVNGGAYTVSLYNNSPSARLVYNRVDRIEGGGVPYYYLHGVGTIHQNGPWAFDRGSGFYLYLTGRFILGEPAKTQGSRVWSYFSEAVPALGGAPRIIEIPAGCYMNTTGGSWSDKIVTANENTHIVGGGTILARNHYNSSKLSPEFGGNFEVAAGKVLEVDAAIRPTDGGVTWEFPGSIGLFGSGTLLLHGTNTCVGAVRLHGNGTLAVTRVGAAGCAAEESCLGTGSEVRFHSNGTLRYVGETADATDRAFTTTNATAALTITFANGGSGAFTLSSHQRMLLANVNGATLRLNAETAPIVFNGTFEEGQAWRMQVAGAAGVSFPVEPGVPVDLADGARLDVPADAVIPSTISLLGDATCVVAANRNLTLARLPQVPGGRALDFIIPEDSSVTLAVRPNLRLDNVTINGEAAQTDDTGRIVRAGAVATTVWTSVEVGGEWSAAANWQNGRKPGTMDNVFIANDDAGASTYSITMDADAQVNGIVMQEQAGGAVTLDGTGTLTLGSGGYTVVTNTTQAKGNATAVAGGPFNIAAPIHFAASQNWLLGSIRGWGYTGGQNTITGDLSSEEDVEWSILGYGRYRFLSGSSANYLGTTRVGVQMEFVGTDQFHRLGTNEIHLYRDVVSDAVAVASGTTNTAPGLLYRFKGDERVATIVNPFRVTGNSLVSGGRHCWNYDETALALGWANTSTALTNRGTRLELSGGISCSSASQGYLQFSQSWNTAQPTTAFRCFDPDFGRIVVSGDGSGFTAGEVRTYTMLEIAHPNAFGIGNNRTIFVGADGYWGQNFPWTVAGVLLRPGLSYSGSIGGTWRSDNNGARNQTATALVGSAETPVVAGATTAVFSGPIRDTSEHSNELRFTAAAGTTAKFTGDIVVRADRWKYHGTPDVVARGDVEFSNAKNTFGTNLCVRAGGLVLDANAAGTLPIVLGGYVPGLIEVRCADGVGAGAAWTISHVTRDDGTVLYGKRMTFQNARTVVDGVRIQPGDLVLDIYPGLTAQPGIWKVVSDTEWQRIDELDEVSDVLANRGLRVHVKEGSTFGGTAHFLVTDPTHHRVSNQYGAWAENLNNELGAPIFHPDTVANPPVGLFTGAATTITNAVVVTANHSTAPSMIGGKTAEASTFSGPVTLEKSVTLAAAAGGTVVFTGGFAGAGDIIGGGAGVSDITAASITLAAANGFRCASGTLKVTADQLGARSLGWARTTAGEGDDWTETTGVLAVTGDLDLHGRALSFTGFERDDGHVESRLLTLATCTGRLTLPADRTVAGSSGYWTLRAEGQTLYARHSVCGMMFIVR